ncbi:MAG: hypothetical protein KGL39_31145 [Patescibacteria group bacterium]|nr:hypothetical protein [Patescibacteria group bacterium]
MKKMRARKPDNAKADREFSAKVLGRDGRVCRMERWNGVAYVEHGIKGSDDNPLQAAHIWGRPHLSPQTKYEPLVGLAACDKCHRTYDAHEKTVRVPIDRYERADVFLRRQQQLGKIKILPPPRIPPEHPEAA